MDDFVRVIGDISRPLSMLFVSICTGVAVIIVALRVEGGTDGALAIGAAGVIAGGMYGFKVLENNKTKAVEGEVEKAKVAAGTST